jgi:hypothetical protein
MKSREVTLGFVFTTHHFLFKLQIGPISQGVTLMNRTNKLECFIKLQTFENVVVMFCFSLKYHIRYTNAFVSNGAG